MKSFIWSDEQDGRLVAQYRAGIPIREIVKAFRPSRSKMSLYRRLQVLDEPLREIEIKQQPSGYYVAIVVKSQCHRLIQELLREAKDQRVNCKDLAAGSGVSKECINLWNRGGNASLGTLEAVGSHLGMKLEWQPEEK